MIASLKLYSTPCALFLWAFLWALEIQGTIVIGIGLLLLGLTTVIAERERSRRRRRRGKT